MNWLNRLFKTDQITKDEIIEFSELLKLGFQKSYSTFYSGIDLDFINLIYFKDDNQKKEYYDLIVLFLSENDIDENTPFSRVNDLIVKYEYEGGDKWFVFMHSAFLYASYNVYVKGDKILKELIRNDETYPVGALKLNDYYLAMRLVLHNIKNKIIHGEKDCQFELNLLEKNLVGKDGYDYVGLSTTVELSKLYLVNNRIREAEMFLKMFINGTNNSHISNSTIGEFYKEIGETYLILEDYLKALEFFNMGVQINPKLGVKRKIIEIENKIQ